MEGSGNTRNTACYLGPFCHNALNEPEPKECMNCPGLCLTCIENRYGIDTACMKDTTYRIVYVVSGRIRLLFPCTNSSKLLDKNEIMLIANETKFILESGDNCLANCVVKDLDKVKISLDHKNGPRCSYLYTAKSM